MTINNAMRDYAIITFNMHKGTKSYKEMAGICQMSETTFGDVIRTDNAVANKNWDYIVKLVDDKKRSKDNIIYSAMRLIDADQFLADETEAYISAQIQIHKPELLLLNSLVHKKIQLLIKDAPTSKPKRGKWIPHPNNEFPEWSVCTACGLGVKTRDITDDAFTEYNYHYCPYCGAYMRGGE